MTPLPDWMQRTPRLRLGFNPGVIGAGSLIREVHALLAAIL
jgi:hypothetical protein